MSKWEWKKLGDLYPIVMGKTPPRGDSSNWDKQKNTHNVWVSIADISANENGVIRDSKEYISNKAAKNIKLVAPKSLLVSFKLSIGKMAFAGVPLYTNEAIISLPPRKDISLEYLHKYFLYFDWDKACLGDVKVKGKTLNKGKLKNINVLVPPLSKFLDNEFSKIDTLKTNAETNLKNAKELFESTLEKELNPLSRHSERSEESRAELPSGWEWKKMRDVCDVRDGTHDSPKYHKEGYPLVTSKNLKNGLIDIDNVKYISKEDYDAINKRSKVCIGDILFAMIGTIGNAVLVTEEPYYAIKNVALFKKSSLINPSFLRYILNSSFILEKMQQEAKGTTQRFVGLDYLRSFQIPLPPLSVQKEIVARLDKLSENVKCLEANYKQIIANCDELKKSILKKTFEGES